MKKYAPRILLALLAPLACSDSTAPATTVEGSLRESAAIRIDSSGVRMLVGSLTLENLALTPQAIVWGHDCSGNGPLDIRMYSAGRLVWESSRVQDLRGCATLIEHTDIGPHVSGTFEWRTTVSAILGDSLAEGEYTFFVQPALESPSLTAQLGVGSLRMADPIAVPPGTNLNGTWTGSSGGLAVSLQLTWTADSVRGSGTYTVANPPNFNCVAISFFGSGTVSFAAHRTNDVVGGGLMFDWGYWPPYGGRLRTANRFDGSIFTVDSGSCALTLTRAP